MANNKIIRMTAEQQLPTIISEMRVAADALQHVSLGVSVFGSARIPPSHPFYALGVELGARIARLGLPLIAGGGPGLMEAANRGAYESGGRSIGLNIKLPREASDNRFQTDSLYFEYFNSRKTSFFMHSLAYVALPGGFGTLDELFEALTLVQTRKQPPAPIILIGVEFWSALMDWIQAQLVPHGMINPQDMDLILLTDDLDQAMQRIEDAAAETAPQREPALPE